MKSSISVVLILAVLIQCTLGAQNLKTSRQAKFRVVGGKNASNKYVKGAVLILYTDNDNNDVNKCTGTIVGRNYVLSAASCFVDSNGDPFGDSFARWKVAPSTKYTDDTDSRLNVRKIHVHRSFKGTDYRYNIAVLELERNVPLRKFKTVSLTGPPRNNAKVKVVGYGRLDDAKVEADRLQMADMVYRKYSWCNPRQQNAVSVTLNSRRNLCAVSLNWPVGQTGVCDGDEGGPLYKSTGGSSLQQFGIYSFSSYGCGAYNALPWFTRISSFRGAINRIINTGSDGKFDDFEGDRSGFPAATTT